jgi:hypothetical protein
MADVSFDAAFTWSILRHDPQKRDMLVCEALRRDSKEDDRARRVVQNRKSYAVRPRRSSR